MKKIIGGKMYNTETALKIAEWANDLGKGDFEWCREVLYKKIKTGEFFLYGEGGGLSPYAGYYPGGGYTDGKEINPITEDEARKWAENKLDADEYEEIFGPVEE